MLLSNFYKITNIPVVLNTSFNVKRQPIVNDPDDALLCFLKYSRQFSKKNKVNFIDNSISEIPTRNKEAFYREYRYNYFDCLRIKNKYNFIFTAHHYYDQLETIYMRTLGKYDWTNLL